MSIITRILTGALLCAGTMSPASAQTPKPIVEKLQREVADIYADGALAARLDKAGLSAESSTSEELGAFIRGETARWSEVIKSGIADKILD